MPFYNSKPVGQINVISRSRFAYLSCLILAHILERLTLCLTVNRNVNKQKRFPGFPWRTGGEIFQLQEARKMKLLRGRRADRGVREGGWGMRSGWMAGEEGEEGLKIGRAHV